MRKIMFALLGVLMYSQSLAFVSEIKTYNLSDGEQVLGRLCVPDSGSFNTVVFVIHGTGPNTYLNMRPGFNYYDDIASGFCERGVAYFTYNRRGVTVDENNPPMFDAVDSVAYLKYTPWREAEDVENMITALRKDERLKDAKFILYGVSEGTIIAPLVAERKKVDVNALFLHGYANENMYDVIGWQNEGHGVMIMANQVFDKNKDGKIDRNEFKPEDPNLQAYTQYLFGGAPFDSLDMNKNQYLDIEDIGVMRGLFHEKLMEKIREGDDRWIQDNYFHITTVWLREHFALEPNKTRLLRLDLPIYVFHGTHDPNVPVEGVYDIEERFRVSGKTNLTVHVFDRHNHDLNYALWIVQKKWSKGLLKIFDTAAELSRQ